MQAFVKLYVRTHMCVSVAKYWHVSKLPSCLYSQLHVHEVYCFHSSVEVAVHSKWTLHQVSCLNGLKRKLQMNRIYFLCKQSHINRTYLKFQLPLYYSLSADSFCCFYALASPGSSLARSHRGHGEVKYVAMCFLIDMYCVFLKGSTTVTGKKPKC